MENKNLEIEKKFLVILDDYEKISSRQIHIVQGYLSTVPERTVRIRIQDQLAFLTIKGINAGASRFEWETEIPLTDAQELLKICEPGVIDKIRCEVPVGKFTFEVDKFYGENQGLIVAEIELSDENEKFPIPIWLGDEITGDKKYYNSNLMKNPYTKWK